MNIKQIQEAVNKTAFIELNAEVDNQKLLKEYKAVEERYGFENYRTNYWPVRRKYAKAWSGICLVSSDGGLFSDLYEGPQAASKSTGLEPMCPYFYQLIKELGGEGCRARIMKISPHESLVWHSHVQEHGQPEWSLTCQVPIVVPREFEYCVVHKDEFKWYKRFYRPSWFKNIERKRLRTGKAYIFNSYHYHNVYNYSDKDRIALMLYLDLRNPKVRNLIERSLV